MKMGKKPKMPGGSSRGQDNNFRVMDREVPKGKETTPPKRKGASMRKK